MSTRSSIGIYNPNGTVDAVYCHFDGYPEGVGNTLTMYHNNEDDAQKIISLGNISHLEKELEPDPSVPHTFNDPQDDVTVFYGRDRGEKEQEAMHYSDIDDWITDVDTGWADYAYLWKDGHWMCRNACTRKEIDLYD